MEVKHALTCSGTSVRHQPVSIVRHAQGSGDICRCQQQMSGRFPRSRIQIGHTFDVRLRDNENVDGRLGCKIAKRDPILALTYEIRRNLTGYDSAEQAIRCPFHHSPFEVAAAGNSAFKRRRAAFRPGRRLNRSSWRNLCKLSRVPPASAAYRLDEAAFARPAGCEITSR